MKSFQKNQQKETLTFRKPDWFKGKNSQKPPLNVKPVSFRVTQHKG